MRILSVLVMSLMMLNCWGMQPKKQINFPQDQPGYDAIYKAKGEIKGTCLTWDGSKKTFLSGYYKTQCEELKKKGMNAVRWVDPKQTELPHEKAIGCGSRNCGSQGKPYCYDSISCVCDGGTNPVCK